MRLTTRRRSKRERAARQAADLARQGRDVAAARRRPVGALVVALGALAAAIAVARARRRIPARQPADAAAAGAPGAPPDAPDAPPHAAARTPAPQAEPVAADEPGHDDAALAREVEEQVARAAHAPGGAVDVTVQDGIVELRGDGQSPAEFRAVFDAAGEVDGVRGVQEPAHPPEQPGPAQGGSAA